MVVCIKDKMMEKRNDPYQIIKHRHVTEKATMLHELQNAKSNPSVSRFELPKYVFVVDREADKKQIATAIEKIYEKLNIRVVSVNTINVKAKQRRVRGRIGNKAAFKKAIVTLEKGDKLDND
jgi:large subunit ribosomal protein L23